MKMKITFSWVRVIRISFGHFDTQQSKPRNALLERVKKICCSKVFFLANSVNLGATCRTRKTLVLFYHNHLPLRSKQPSECCTCSFKNFLLDAIPHLSWQVSCILVFK